MSLQQGEVGSYALTGGEYVHRGSVRNDTVYMIDFESMRQHRKDDAQKFRAVRRLGDPINPQDLIVSVEPDPSEMEWKPEPEPEPEPEQPEPEPEPEPDLLRVPSFNASSMFELEESDDEAAVPEGIPPEPEPEPEPAAAGVAAAVDEAELRSLKVSELRKRALAGGASEEQLDEADDSGDAKAAMLALVLAQHG